MGRFHPRAAARKGRFAFAFPLRPGQTEFQISYHLPYNGKATIDPKLIYPLDHFVVIHAAGNPVFSSPNRCLRGQATAEPPGAIAEVASKARPGPEIPSIFREAEFCKMTVLQTRLVKPPRRHPVRIRVPAEDLDRRLMLPTRCKNIAGICSEDSRSCLIAGAVYIAGRSRNVAEPNFESAVETADRDREAQPARRSSMCSKL